ncbi:MAG TPA: o-succinylbenzoate synthase [Candidatus Micrarchaeia archaeon]|nr:o-succinylbenzoate synthase [Candidatus Micrarchaeia archaeon]
MAEPPGSTLRLDRLPPVRVEGAALRVVELPLRSPFTTSFGTQTVRRAVLVECRGDGTTGVGECAAGIEPAYSSETVGTALGVLRDHLVPGVVGTEPATVADLLGRVAWVRGHHMARAALEMALLDLAGRAAGISLGEVLGATSDRVAAGVSIGIQPSLEATYSLIEGYLAQGYRRIKLKCRPGYDVELARGVRAHFPTTPVMLDANSAYRLGDAATLRQLDAFDLMMLEQPLAHDDLVDHAALQRELRTPICLDESVESVADARAAIQLRAGRIVNIKAGRVGGLIPAAGVHDACRAAGWPVWCGGMLETGVGRAANVALAALPNFTLPGDTSASDRYFEADILKEPFRLQPDGTLLVPTGPGLGVELDPSRVAAATQHHEVVA